MINRVILVGRLTKDPELKSTQSNINFCNFTLAVNRQFSDESGDRQADFIQCIAWRKQAENLAQYQSKGNLIGIEGRIQTRNYESEQGTRYITEVVCDSVQFLDSKSSGEQENEEHHKPYTSAKEIKNKDHGESFKQNDDEFYETSKQLAAEEDLPF
ncbi:MAG: single-stranded DNA-binding protein [Acholeplasmataceae bacterium]